MGGQGNCDWYSKIRDQRQGLKEKSAEAGTAAAICSPSAGCPMAMMGSKLAAVALASTTVVAAYDPLARIRQIGRLFSPTGPVEP